MTDTTKVSDRQSESLVVEDMCHDEPERTRTIGEVRREDSAIQEVPSVHEGGQEDNGRPWHARLEISNCCKLRPAREDDEAHRRGVNEGESGRPRCQAVHHAERRRRKSDPEGVSHETSPTLSDIYKTDGHVTGSVVRLPGLAIPIAATSQRQRSAA